MKQNSTPTQKALNLWALILIVWSVYRANFHLPEWFDEFIAKPLVFILPVYYYIKFIDKKNFFDDLDIKWKMVLPDFLYGIVIGLVFIGSIVLANLLKAGKPVTGSQSLAFGSIALVAATALATSISEEILSRGFILKKLYEESKNIYTSSFFASILFFFLHVPILMTTAGLTGNLLLLFMATDIVLSLVNSFIFLERKSLVLPIFIHMFYIIALTLFV